MRSIANSFGAPQVAPAAGRFKRWLGRAVIVIVVILVGALVAGRLFLGTRSAAQMVAKELSAKIGLPVQVHSLSAGPSSTSVDQIEIGEAAGANDGRPWIIAKQIEGDRSVLGLIAGDTPGQITLRQAFITLRFDRDGKLLTRLPERRSAQGQTIPNLRFEQCRLLIQQEGHADSEFDGIDGELRDENNHARFEGTLADQFWGRWNVGAEIDTTEFAGHASFKTVGPAKLVPDSLRRVPFLPGSVADSIALTGTTTADIRADFRNKDDSFHCVVKASASCSEIFIPSIDLKSTDTSGEVLVQDSIVTVQKVQGRAASGSFRVDGTLDLKSEPNVFKLTVVAKDMRVKELPADWKIQEKVPVKGIGDGLLSGHADLVLASGKNGTTTGGSGVGTVIVPHFVSGQDLTVGLELRPKGRRLEFENKTGAPSSKRLPSPLERQPNVGELLAFVSLLTAPAEASAMPDNPKGANAQQPSYFDINLSLNDVDLAELISKLNFTAPFKIGGRITFHVKASIPSSSASDLKSYRVVGTATMPRLTLEDLTLENVQLKLVYKDGKLTLDNLSARVPDPRNPKSGGSFKGTASVGLIPQGDLDAQLILDRLPVGQILGFVPELAANASGNLSGQFGIKAPAGNLRDPSKWSGQARLKSERATAVGWQFQNVQLDADLGDGMLTLKRFGGDIEGARLDASGTVKLIGNYPLKGRIDLTQVDLSALNKLAPTVRLPVSVSGTFETHADLNGDLRPLAIDANGTVSASKLRIEEFPIEKLDLNWGLTKERVKVTAIHTELLGGEITGTADLPLRNDGAGWVDLSLKGVDLKQLSKQMPSAASLKLEGSAVGTLKATIPATKPDQSRAVEAVVDVQAKELKVRNIPAEKMHAVGDYRNGVLKYKVEAAALGGTIELDGRFPPEKEPVKDPAPEENKRQGQLTVKGIQLARLWGPLGLRDSLGPLHGEVSFTLPFHYDAAGEPVGTGQFQLAQLRFGDHEIAPRITSVARLTATELRLEQIETSLGAGSLSGLIILNRSNIDASRAALTMRGVPADRLLFAFPSLAARIDSRFDVQLRTSLGSQMRGGAVISTAGGKFFGQTVGMLRLPFEWDVAPAWQRGVLTLRDLSGELSRGRVAGQASYEFFGDVGSRVEGDIHFTNVGLAALLHSQSNLSSYGVGQATGRFQFSGSAVRSIDDLTGTLNATLGRTQLSQVPILSKVMPFLGRSDGAADQRSSLRAVLNHGIWRVERLALLGSNLQLFADGTVTNSGRLNLNVTANTGQLIISPLTLRVAGLALPVMAGPIPVSAIVNLSTYISNRTITLNVTGTIDHPVVQIQPIKLLTQEAIQFFLNQSNIPTP